MQSDEKAPTGAGRRTLLAAAFRYLWPGSVFDYGPTVATEQALLLARICFIYALFGIFADLLIFADFRSEVGLVGGAAALVLPVLYLVLVTRARVMLLRHCAKEFLNAAVVLLATIGTAWGCLLLVIASTALPSQRSVVGGVMIGLLSASVIAVPFSAFLAFFVPVALADLLTFCFALRPFDPYITLCYVGFVSFTYVSTTLLNRSSLERSVARFRLQHQHEVAKLFLRNYEENATDWSWELGTDLRFHNISRRFAAALKAVPPEMRRWGLRALAKNAKIDGLQALLDAFDSRKAFRDVVIRMETPRGLCWWSVTGQPIYDTNAHFTGYRGIASDITELRHSEAQIRHLANHDSLTSLANRSQFIARLDEACRGVRDNSRPCFVLLLIDLDRFKEVNDTHGHMAGDKLLIALGERLLGALRQGDTAYRLGGDEFAAILRITDEAEAAQAADRILKGLQEPYSVQDMLLHPGVSIGLTFVPTDGREPETLMRHADLALYNAKAAGRSTWRRYLPGMEAEQAELAIVRNDLKLAADDEFLVEYQPIIDVATGCVVAAEALVRWPHPTRGRIPPAKFIPVAEDSGLISRLGAMVLQRGCHAAAAWPPHMSVAVNVSALQVRDPGFLRQVDRALAESGLPPKRLEIELTETALLRADPASLGTIEGLCERGVQVVLDDFGTGYSSLAALTRFPFGGVKIDAQFTSRVKTDDKARAIVRAVGRIAAELDISVTAEGVETEDQLRFLSALAIPRAQGFLISRPLPLDSLMVFLRESPFASPDTMREPVRVPATAVYRTI